MSGTTGVCQLPAESLCAAGTPCETGEVCGTDLQCRVQCTTTGGCVTGDYCLISGATGACYSSSTPADEPTLISEGILSADGGVVGDAATVLATPDGSVVATGTDGASAPDALSGLDGASVSSMQDGAGDGGDATVATNPCVNPQITFSFVGQGDANPHFLQAVGARSTNALFIFSAYNGPDPGVDGGGSTVNTLFAQAFDPSTATSLGPAKSIFPAGTDLRPAASMSVYSAAVAPTGQIIVLYNGDTANKGNDGLYAAFLTPSSDAGVALGGEVGLQVERLVEVASTYSPDGVYEAPQVIWSNASNSFLVSYRYSDMYSANTAISEYSADGAAMAGGTSLVPTDSAGFGQTLRPTAGVSRALVGVPFLSTLPSTLGYPGLTVLNLDGTQAGSPIYLANTKAEGEENLAVAGTPDGFVVAFSEQSSTLIEFIPTSSSGIVNDAGAFPTMTVSGGATTSGTGLLAVGDDVGTGGANGVGVALSYGAGASFAYVSADGSKVLGPVLAIPNAQGTMLSTTNYNGSTVLTLYQGGPNSAQITASGCH